MNSREAIALDVISMRDFSKEEILCILDTAEEIKRAIHNSQEREKFKEKHGRDLAELLEDKYIVTLFVENSTRTNYSTRAAVLQMGGKVDGFPTEDYTSLGKGETWADTAEMFAGYGAHALIMRSSTEGLPRWTKETLQRNDELMKQQYHALNLDYGYETPMIINGGDGKNQHPTQCFIDLFTMREIARKHGQNLEKLSLALTNDIANSRVQSSIMSVAPLFQFTLHFAYPQGFGPKQQRLEELKRKNVLFYDHQENLKEALQQAMIAVHCRPQKERVGSGDYFDRVKKWGMITKELYDTFGEKAPYLMHPKPIDSETFEEIHHSMKYHHLNMTNVQASNGLYIRMALLALGLGRIDSPFAVQAAEKQERSLTLDKLLLNEETKVLQNPRTGYIEGNGIVLDHIPAGMGRRLAGVLGLEREGVSKTISDYIVVESGKKPVKDIIKIHGLYTLSSEQFEVMALLAPDITLSYIEDGKVKQKIRPKLGDQIKNAITCSNSDCVTRVQKEHAAPSHYVEKEGEKTVLRCHYCETAETISTIYKENRFRYIGERD